MAEYAGNLSSTVTKAIVTAVVTALAGAIISWIGGWLPALWEGGKAGAAWIWALLSYPVAVPTAILALLVLPFLIRAVRGIRHIVTPPRAQAAAPAEPPLSDLERQLLRMLANRDGAQVIFEEAANQLGVAKLVLQQTCEALTERGYIQPVDHRLWGLAIALTRDGRDFVIQQGFVR